MGIALLSFAIWYTLFETLVISNSRSRRAWFRIPHVNASHQVAGKVLGQPGAALDDGAAAKTQGAARPEPAPAVVVEICAVPVWVWSKAGMMRSPGSSADRVLEPNAVV
jgi:hypothetical protein